MEILDHSESSIRLGRLNAGGAVLVGHNHDDQVGVIDEVRIDSDRTGRAVLRFGKSSRAEEIFQDVLDGIRRFISVGYRIYKSEYTEGERGTPDTYRAIDWEPHEISFVSVPADPDVGVGRDDSETSNQVEMVTTKVVESEEINPENIREESLMTTENTMAPVVNTEESLTAERARASRINALGRKHDLGEEAERAIDEGRSLESFQNDVLDHLASDNSGKRSVANLELNESQVRRYDLFKAIRAAQTGNWKGAEFERELSREIEMRSGAEAKGFFVPFDVQNRTMTVGGAGTGAELVGTDHLAGSFIDTLRTNSVLGQTGATYLTGLVGDVDIPKRSGDGTTYHLAEDADVADSDQVTSSVLMAPKTIATSIPLSRRLLKQGSPSAQAMVLSGIAANMAIGIDNAAINGSGAAGQPLGILSQTGINTQAVVAPGSPTWAELVGFEAAVELDEALAGNLFYVVNPGVKQALKTTSKDSGSGRFLMENGEANGYRVISSTQIGANGILFGNFSDVVVGMWGMLDIAPDAAAKAASGGLVLRAFQDYDIAVRNAVSFCKNA
jgi:HK97 family phage major capsid protein/HK97 family phage prohead protease